MYWLTVIFGVSAITLMFVVAYLMDKNAIQERGRK